METMVRMPMRMCPARVPRNTVSASYTTKATSRMSSAPVRSRVGSDGMKRARSGIDGPATILTCRRGRAAYQERISSTADTMNYAFRSGTRRHRGDPRRAHRGGGGRRRPGKRRRPHDRGGEGDAGDHQFHGGAGTRADLSGADPGALRLTAAAADEPDQHFHVRDGILRIDRRARRGDHGDLGGGSQNAVPNMEVL